MNGDTKYIIYKLHKNGINYRDIRPEYFIKDMQLSVDIMILPALKNKNADFKGIAIELNGPTHYYYP